MQLNPFPTAAHIAATLIAALLCAGCAMQQPEPAPPLVPANFAETQSHVIVPPNPLDALSPSVRSAYLTGKPNPVRDGFAWIYRYQPYDQVKVYCAPMHLTQIAIADDEHVVSAGAGDTSRWAIQPTGNRVLVKPVPDGGAQGANAAAGGAGGAIAMPSLFSTNLIIQGSKRTYDIKLQAGGRAHAMELVTYFFPDDIAAAQAARQKAMRKAAQQAAEAPTAQLNFNYTIDGPPVSWRPLQAFDDGSHEYLEFADDAMLRDDAPVRYVQRGKTRELVNYERRGSYFVVDRLYSDAAVTQGVGTDRQTVRIQATGGAH